MINKHMSVLKRWYSVKYNAEKSLLLIVEYVLKHLGILNVSSYGRADLNSVDFSNERGVERWCQSISAKQMFCINIFAGMRAEAYQANESNKRALSHNKDRLVG